MSSNPILAVIGGSSLYSIPGMQHIQEYDLDTPFGKPSAPVIVGTIEGSKIAFLARHGIGHFISPGEINYRANIYALKSLCVERIVSVSACGSLREDYKPGDVVVPNQIFDFTRDRKRTFFGEGLVVHISAADPFCEHLALNLAKATEEAGGTIHFGGAYIAVEGPRFSTRAESNVFRSWGMSIIGMTASPEAFLAREAEICYAVMAHVTDYDVWHTSEAPVTVDIIVKNIQKYADLAPEVIKKLLAKIPPERSCECSQALDGAIITRRDLIPQETRQKVGLLVDKYLGS